MRGIAFCTLAGLVGGGVMSCGFPRPANVGPDDATGGSSTDGTGSADANLVDMGAPADAALCFQNARLKVCFATPPSGDRVFTSTNISTDDVNTCMPTMSASIPVCVIDAAHISIPSGITLTASGSKPLVLIGAQGISIAGTLDVSSHHPAVGLGTVIGPNANGATCLPGTPPQDGGGGGGKNGGGAGGSFIGTGGTGGAGGVLVGTLPPPGGIPGAAIAADFHGGCKGQAGGGGGGAGGSQLPGDGGGAVMLMGAALAGSGTIDASGSGARNPQNTHTGGAGAGSGGYIGIGVSANAFTGVAIANGGSGSEGTGSNPQATPGDDAPLDGTAAQGGTGGGSGGDGGNGSTATQKTGDNGKQGETSNDGGGGGGGGGGLVEHLTPT